MSKELAVVDGLDKLLAGQSLDIKALNDLRLKNLISQFYSNHKISIGKPYVENKINEYRLKDNIVFEKKEIYLILDNGNLSIQILSNTHLKKAANKL